jgi:hypothetical protein
MIKTMDAPLVKPAPRVRHRAAAKAGRRSTLSLVEGTLRLFMWTLVALFTLLLTVVIALG